MVTHWILSRPNLLAHTSRRETPPPIPNNFSAPNEIHHKNAYEHNSIAVLSFSLFIIAPSLFDLGLSFWLSADALAAFSNTAVGLKFAWNVAVAGEAGYGLK